MTVYKKRKLESLLAPFQDEKDIIVVTGFRRVGKTSLMQHIYDACPANKLFLDLESPVNQKIFQKQNYHNILQNLSSQGIDSTQKAYIFLDEIQKVKELPSAVKYLYDHHDIKFYLTGSSSFYLKNYFSESLAGRKVVFELFPLDFEEFLEFKEVKLTPSADYEYLSGLYDEYIHYGGFPSVVLQSSTDKKTLALDDILGSYFELDVKSLSDFRSNEQLKNLLFLLTSRVGSKLDVTKLAQSLGVSRPTVYEYVHFFEQTYLIHLLKPLSGSPDIQVRSIPKLYFNDTGLLNRVGQLSAGQLFENNVFTQLYKSLHYSTPQKYGESRLYYYQRKSGAEIDFIVDNKTGYEVKLHATDADLKTLKRAAKHLKLTDYRVVTLKKSAPGTEKNVVYPYNLRI